MYSNKPDAEIPKWIRDGLVKSEDLKHAIDYASVKNGRRPRSYYNRKPTDEQVASCASTILNKLVSPVLRQANRRMQHAFFVYLSYCFANSEKYPV